MLIRSVSLTMSTSVLKALPVKLDIKRHSTSILYLSDSKILKLKKKQKHLFKSFFIITFSAQKTDLHPD